MNTNTGTNQKTEDGGRRAEAFFRGVRVGPLAAALLGIIGTAVVAERKTRQRATGNGQGAGRLRCVVWPALSLGLLGLEPSIENAPAVLWFGLGGLLGVGAWAVLRVARYLDDEARADESQRRAWSAREETEAHIRRQRARILTESEHRELLLTALADAMRTPMRRVDIRGVPALWSLTEPQRATWLAWLRGKELEWSGLRWVAGVERHEHLVFVKFALQEWRKGPRHEGTEAMSMTTVEPRKVTEQVVVARCNTRTWPTPTVEQPKEARS